MSAKLLQINDVLDCIIIGRINRFVVEIDVEGQSQRAWINNSGRLLELIVEGRPGYCFRHTGKKTTHRLFAIAVKGGGALIDTNFQMRCFEAALENGLIPWLKGWRMVSRDAKLGKSLIDYRLTKGNETAFLEVKSAVLRINDLASYPDCPTERGRRHIKELTKYSKSGGKAFVCFAAALPGVSGFKPCAEGDPQIPVLLKKAKAAGVKIGAISMHFDIDAKSVVLDSGNLAVQL